jgi:Ca-activated chloride channel family protein
VNVDFDQLGWLNLLWALPAVVALGVYGTWQRRRALRRFAAARLLPALAPPVGWFRPLVRLACVVVTLTALVAALLGPRWGEAAQTVVRRNIDVLVLLDVSRSMLARDIAPDRLERAKLAVRDDLLPALGGDRIGLITFAGTPSLRCPLTSDYGFFRLALDDVSTQSSPRGGTAIGDAIRAAVAAFKSPLDTHRLIILITDGEDHESYPVDAARAAAAEHRVGIVAIGVGDPREGARIPLGDGRYVEHDGEPVWSRADFEQLREITRAAPLGVFVPAGTADFDLGAVYERVAAQLDRHEQAEQQTVRRPTRHYPFLLVALAAWLVDALIGAGTREPRRAARDANGLERAAA